MSTRAYINIRVKDEDMNTSKVFNASLQSVIGFCVVDGDDEYPVRYHKVVKFSKRKPVLLDKQYLSVYSHWDGYPGNLGMALLLHYRNYDTVLNLLLGGTIESLYHERVSYAYDNVMKSKRWSKEDIGYCDAQTSDTPCEEEYSYLFENDKWYVKGHSIQEYTPLTDVVCDIITGKRDRYGEVKRY